MNWIDHPDAHSLHEKGISIFLALWNDRFRIRQLRETHRCGLCKYATYKLPELLTHFTVLAYVRGIVIIVTAQCGQ